MYKTGFALHMAVLFKTSVSTIIDRPNRIRRDVTDYDVSVFMSTRRPHYR